MTDWPALEKLSTAVQFCLDGATETERLASASYFLPASGSWLTHCQRSLSVAENDCRPRGASRAFSTNFPSCDLQKKPWYATLRFFIRKCSP